MVVIVHTTYVEYETGSIDRENTAVQCWGPFPAADLALAWWATKGYEEDYHNHDLVPLLAP